MQEKGKKRKENIKSEKQYNYYKEQINDKKPILVHHERKKTKIRSHTHLHYGTGKEERITLK